MKYLSVCSGIEAATVAWHSMNWEAVGYSEIECFPSAVLNHHYPNVPNYGDMIKFKEWPDANVTLLVGGTPCQSFSIAGLRKGLADPRGNLCLTFLAILDRYHPRWVIWENVVGVLSSNQGRDFGAFLGGLGQLGYGWTYRVLNAQYFGVPQRRRRVFVVGYLGDWRSAAAVLLEENTLYKYPAPSIGMEFDSTSDLIRRTEGSNEIILDKSVIGTLSKVHHPTCNQSLKSGYIISHTVDNVPGVRYLTPNEWERCQGFPDDYTLISWPSEKKLEDFRYQVLGDSMAVPVMKWLGERINEVERNPL